MSTKKLKDLFESSVLNEESKAMVQEAFDAAVSTELDSLREAEELKFAEKLSEARDQFATEMVSIIREAVDAEIVDLKEEIVNSRTLEETYAEKLVAFKEKFYESASSKMDAAIEEKVKAEMDELRDSIDEARKNEMGRKIFESFKAEILEQGMVDESDLKSVQGIKNQMAEQEKTIDSLKRDLKLKEILESVTEAKKGVVSTMLEDTDTDNLESKFEKIMESMSNSDGDDDKSLEKAKKAKAKNTMLEEGAVIISENKYTNKKEINRRFQARLAAGLED